MRSVSTPPDARALPFVLGMGGATFVGTSALVRMPCLSDTCSATLNPGGVAVVLAATGFALGAGWTVFRSVEGWTTVAVERPLGRLLFDPSRATLAALAPTWLVTVLFARPLFTGTLGVGEGTWLLFAFPYYPFLVVAGAAAIVLWQFDVWLLGKAAGPTWFVAVAGMVVVAWFTVAVEVVWLYLLAATVGRVAEAAFRSVTLAVARVSG